MTYKASIRKLDDGFLLTTDQGKEMAFHYCDDIIGHLNALLLSDIKLLRESNAKSITVKWESEVSKK